MDNTRDARPSSDAESASFYVHIHIHAYSVHFMVRVESEGLPVARGISALSINLPLSLPKKKIRKFRCFLDYRDTLV